MYQLESKALDDPNQEKLKAALAHWDYEQKLRQRKRVLASRIAELIDKSGVKIHTMDGSYEYADRYHTTPEAIMASTLAGFDTENEEDDPDEDEGMGGMSL